MIDGDRGEKRGHPDPGTGEGMTGRIQEMGVPAGLTVRRFRQLVRDGVRRPVEREHPDDRLEEPDAGPHEQRTRPAQDTAAGRGRSSANPGGRRPVPPGATPTTEKHVEADCTGRPLQRRHPPGQHHSEPLAEEVDTRAPYERGHQRRLNDRRKNNPTPMAISITRRGQPRAWSLVRQQIRRVVDGRVDQARLASGHRPDDFRDERGLEDVRLELQEPVDDPDHTERALQCALAHVQRRSKRAPPRGP